MFVIIVEEDIKLSLNASEIALFMDEF